MEPWTQEETGARALVELTTELTYANHRADLCQPLS